MSTSSINTENFSDLAQWFIQDVCGGKNNETPVAYLTKLRYLERFFEEKGRLEITQDSIDEFKLWMLTRRSKIRGKKEVEGSLSPFTIRTVLTTVKHFLRWGYEHNLFPKITLKNISEPQPDPKPIKNNTFDNLLKIAQTFGEDWERARNIALLYLLRDTGSRVGALMRIEVENLDLEHGSVTVMDKGGRYSWLFFGELSCEAIRTWLHYRSQFNPTVSNLFITIKGTPLDKKYVRRILNRLAKAAGIEHERHNPHAFRHAFARDTLLAGADLSQTSQLLNHSSIVTTARYYARWSKRELATIHHKFSPLTNR
jgi:site-specific recombinase XerD